jgi:hypothetical protein
MVSPVFPVATVSELRAQLVFYKSSCVKTAAEPFILCFAYYMAWYPAEV